MKLLHLSTEAMAVDWINNKVYFTDSELRIVGVFDPINFHYKVLFEIATGSGPRAIVLDPTTR